jgi:RNA polymerase sigma-70 factor (ECF subfamily)
MKLVTSGSILPSGPREASEEDPLAALIAGANAGDRAKLQKILEAVAPSMLAVVRVVLGPDHPDVLDVGQESLMALKDALRIFRGESSALQYARQVALLTALSARRRWRSRERRLQEWRRDVIDAPQIGPGEDSLMRARRAAVFRGLLDELPDIQAESFALRVVLDYSLPQVAQATGAPLNTVRSRVRLAKEKLRRRIETDPALRDVLKGGDR